MEWGQITCSRDYVRRYLQVLHWTGLYQLHLRRTTLHRKKGWHTQLLRYVERSCKSHVIALGISFLYATF